MSPGRLSGRSGEGEMEEHPYECGRACAYPPRDGVRENGWQIALKTDPAHAVSRGPYGLGIAREGIRVSDRHLRAIRIRSAWPRLDMLRELRLIGLTTIPEVRRGDDVAALIVEAAAREGVGIEDGDVAVVASKIASKAGG